LLIERRTELDSRQGLFYVFVKVIMSAAFSAIGGTLAQNNDKRRPWNT